MVTPAPNTRRLPVKSPSGNHDANPAYGQGSFPVRLLGVLGDADRGFADHTHLPLPAASRVISLLQRLFCLSKSICSASHNL